MLVINGVDAQTNSHSAGIVHNWSGRVSQGYPSMTALLAAHHGPALSLGYLSFGGFSDTAGLTTFTRLDGAGQIRNIASPHINPSDDGQSSFFLNPSEWEALKSLRASNVERLVTAPNLLPRAARNRRLFESGLLPEAAEGLKAYADLIPPKNELERPERSGYLSSELRFQAQLTILAFKARVAVSADLLAGWFRHPQQSRP